MDRIDLEGRHLARALRAGPLAGAVRYTSDPGRALISGKCADLEQVVEFYNLRFEMGLTSQENADLVARSL